MSFADLLKSLAQEYLAALPEKIAKIEEQIRAQSPEQLRESFHKLKGTGKTYGFPEVSELAQVVEDICKDQPVHALKAAEDAVQLLRDIHATRQSQQSFDCTSDARFVTMQKLLQN